MKAVTRDEKQENHHSTNTISRRDALVTATSAFAAASMLQSSVLIAPARCAGRASSRVS
jgi:hypothetical protein